jgi:hypothetical protein
MEYRKDSDDVTNGVNKGAIYNVRSFVRGIMSKKAENHTQGTPLHRADTHT